MELSLTLEETPAKEDTSANNSEIEDSLFNRNNNSENNNNRNNGSIFDFFNW